MQPLVLLLLALTLSAGAISQPSVKPTAPQPAVRSYTPATPGMDTAGPPVIMNYWIHINNLLREDGSRRTTTAVRPGATNLIRKSYPFEKFGHLRAKDLLRAAREGIEAARTAAWGKTQPEIEREITKNLITAFEYYPLLAQDDADLKPLLLLIEDPRGEEMLRLFLIERCTPGIVSPSLFSTYFQEALARNPGPARLALKNIVSSPVERPRILCVAIRALYEFFRDEYGRFLAEDPGLAAYAERKNVPVTPELLLEPDAPALSGDVARLNPDYITQWTGIARSLSELAGPGTSRPEKVQAQARAYFERICAIIPVKNRDALMEAMNPTVPDAPAESAPVQP